MSGSGPATIRVPAHVGDEPELVSAAVLAGGPEPTILVAGPPPGLGTGVVVLAWRGGRSERLLTLPDLTLERAVSLAPSGDGRAMALIPGHGLLRLDPDLPDQARGARRLVPDKALPSRLADLEGVTVALAQRPDGRTSWTSLRPTGAAVAGSRAAGPTLGPGQRLSGLLLDGAGGLVAVADDEEAGLAAWRREGDGPWAQVAAEGAGRFAFNAAALGAVAWEGRVAVAAGPTEAVRGRLLGMAMTGEILLLGPGERPALLAGELRATRWGLLVPEVGARGMAAMGRGVVTRLAAVGGLLVASVERGDGATLIRGITPSREVIDLGEAPGPAIPLALGQTLALVTPVEG